MKIRRHHVGSRRRRIASATVIMGITVALAQLAFAQITSKEGSFLHKVRVVRSTNVSSTSSTGWVNVPGASATITVPSNHIELILARFAAESSCHGGTGWCSVRILVHGSEMAPVVGTNYAFDSSDNGMETSASWEGHAMERSKSFTGSCSGPPLPKKVTVQFRVSNPSLTFRLDDFHLTVENFHSSSFVC